MGINLAAGQRLFKRKSRMNAMRRTVDGANTRR